MSSNTPPVLRSSSAFYSKIIDKLKQCFKDNIITVEKYSDYGHTTINRPTLLLEIEDSESGSISSAGLYCHSYNINIHCLIPCFIQESSLHVLDLASDVERIVYRNTWGINSSQIDYPEYLRMESGFSGHSIEGLETRSVSWKQNIYLDPLDLNLERYKEILKSISR